MSAEWSVKCLAEYWIVGQTNGGDLHVKCLNAECSVVVNLTVEYQIVEDLTVEWLIGGQLEDLLPGDLIEELIEVDSDRCLIVAYSTVVGLTVVGLIVDCSNAEDQKCRIDACFGVQQFRSCPSSVLV